LFFPHYATRSFNQFHVDFFENTKYGERSFRRASAAPRGSAKSTLATLVKPIHDVCYGLEQFIIIISNTAPLADQKLKDIRAEILSNDLLADVYGVNFPRKNPGETQFIINSDEGSCMFMAFGRGAQVRGVRYGAYRPSKIVCDDVEHSEEVYNERIRHKTENWFQEDVTKSGNEHTNIEFVGTILHKQSLLSKLVINPSYRTKKYQSVISWAERQDLWNKWEKIFTNLDNPNRLEDSNQFYQDNEAEMLKGTKVLWPDKEPYLYLMKEMIEIGKRSFFKEKQNDPLGNEDKIFENVHWYIERKEGLFVESTQTLIPWNELSQCFGTLDPSTGQTKSKKGKLGDFTCILTGYYHYNSKRIFVHHDWTKRAAPTVFIKEIFESHNKFKYTRFGVEENLYRNLLLENIKTEKRNREKLQDGKLIDIEFQQIIQTENKEGRIFALEPKAAHGYIVFNRALSVDFKTQLEEFPHADHDDCPDALEMLWSMVHNRYSTGVVAGNMGSSLGM
jgi:predicted phage terminase large subunit-like protein